MQFLKLPNELLILIASDLGFGDLNSLLRCNRALSILLTPLLHKRALLDKDGLAPLYWAAHEGHEHLARLLLDMGADINVRSGPNKKSENKQTPLQAAISAKEPSPAMIKLLVERGASLEAKNSFGNTPLHDLVSSDPPTPHASLLPAISLLLAHGASLSAQNIFGETPLHRVYDGPHCGKVIPLLLNKADPAILGVQNRDGATILHKAVQYNDITSLRRVLKMCKKLINVPDFNRETPLQFAAYMGYADIVKELLKRGADVHVKGFGGQTALYWAEYYEHTEIVKMLKWKGAKVDWKVVER
ncbi:ankyrin [Choiromyces venosus 120613-1]|uniref:Ankyrin n=1 Tax=Choiromyces venosus 120613-1 TaxID=1336337 RepID=A0A3N4JYC9_9PEZI|nr:ankyrin [Choiromyces venosus 120613-1]